MTSYVYSFICIIILLLGVFRSIYRKFRTHVAFSAAVRDHGCFQVPKYHHRDWLGYDLYRERIAAAKCGKSTKIYESQFTTYGKVFQEYQFGTKIINTIEPSALQYTAALATQDFTRVEQTRSSISVKLIGSGVLTTDGPRWKRARDLIKPVFSRSELSDVTIIQKHVDHLLEVLPRDGRTIDAQAILKNLFLDASSEFLLGESLNTLGTETTRETQVFLRAFEDALVGLARRRSAGRLWRLRFMFDRSFIQSCSKVHAFIDGYVSKALAETAVECQSPGKKSINPVPARSTDRYILLYEMAKEIRDPIDLRSQMLNIFIPSRDNVAIATASALFHLSRNPELWSELRHVALAIDQPLTFELLRSLTPFKHVFLETLRVQAPTNRVLRTALRDTLLPIGGGPDGKSPVFVEKGTVIHHNIFLMHRDPDIWGDDAHLFRPERWREHRPKWDFVPFSGGPRICPANQQAQTQFVYVLVRLAQEFERIERRDSTWEYVQTMKLTTESMNGVMVGLIRSK